LIYSCALFEVTMISQKRSAANIDYRIEAANAANAKRVLDVGADGSHASPPCRSREGAARCRTNAQSIAG